MQASKIEIEILNKLLRCRYQPGSFDKKFPQQVDINNMSPLQQWWIYKLGFKYRKQIRNDIYELICKNFLENNDQPQSRKESTKLLKKAFKNV